MSAKKQKYYVVWVGIEPGVYDNWEDAAEQVLTFPGAKYKSYPTRAAAIRAFRGDDAHEGATLLNMLQHAKPVVNYEAFPEIDPNGWATDAACSGNPGAMEYRCVEIGSGREIFHSGPHLMGTNNIGEYLALIHALALCHNNGDTTRHIYTDSATALAWLRHRHSNTRIPVTPETRLLIEMLRRADVWIATHSPTNPVTKWDTAAWGEIPADFGRK